MKIRKIRNITVDKNNVSLNNLYMYYDIIYYDMYYLCYIYHIKREREIFQNYLEFLPSFIVKQNIKNIVQRNFFSIRTFLL